MVYLAVNLTFAASKEGGPDLPAHHAESADVMTTPILSNFQGVDTRIIRIASIERKPPAPETKLLQTDAHRHFQNVVATENLKVLRGSRKVKFPAKDWTASWKVKSPAAPAGNMSRVIGTGEDVVVFSRRALYAQ
jgi:hypothetical protein